MDGRGGRRPDSGTETAAGVYKRHRVQLSGTSQCRDGYYREIRCLPVTHDIPSAFHGI